MKAIRPFETSVAIRQHDVTSQKTWILRNTAGITWNLAWQWSLGFQKTLYVYQLQLGCHPVAEHIYTQTIHRTTQITYVEECGPYPVFANFTLAFALQLRKKYGKTSVRVRETSVGLRKPSVRVQYTYYQTTHTNTNITKPTHTHTHTHTHITKQYNTTTVQIKTNTVQDIPKRNSHNIIKFRQHKVTLMYTAQTENFLPS